MRTDVTEEGGKIIVAASGRLDAATAPAFDEALLALPQTTPPKSVLLDLGALEFVSSAGLRSLLTLAKNLKSAGAPLAFCSLSPMVADVFKISGLTSIFKIYPDRGSALAALGEG
ncbi:MAG: STAS domain-containing protein [Deltaproteobacteria bacterium]|jgi:anti-anti-sigma factor|nr:STAS domain-containing protein [Deltaproteobacteria bacterium]